MGDKGYYLENEDDDEVLNTSETQEDSSSFWHIFIIARKSIIYKLWSVFEVFCCLSSSYIYAYMAAFENPEHGTTLFDLFLFYEIIFLVAFMLNFLVEYTPKGEEKPVREYKKIAWNYLKGNFALDFIPLVPLQFIDLPGGKERLFIVIKLIRIFNGIKVFKVRSIMSYIENYFHTKLDNIIENDPELAEDKNVDSTNIGFLLTLNSML